MNLKDKVVIITGASSGIGRELAIQAAKAGAKVVLAARNKDALESLARQINSEGGRSRSVPTDVSRRDQVEHLVAKTIQEFGRLDIFVSNAGISHLSQDLSDLPEEDFRRVMETNLMGGVYAVWAAAPVMEKNGGGQLVFVSSVIGKRGIPRNAGYCASKFALQGLTESLRPELRKKNIHVLTVCPPGVDTPFFVTNKHEVKRKYRLHPVDKIAKMIIQAMEKEKREVWLTMDAKLLTWASFFMPGIMDRLIARVKATQV